MNRNRIALPCHCVLLMIFTVAGCQSQEELTKVHGKVLFQGKPLEYGSVMFQPEGNGPLARATIQSDGTFVLATNSNGDGVRPGKCRVRVTAFAAQQSSEQSNTEQELVLGKSAIPRKYQSFGTSGLEFTVAPGMQLPLIIDLN